MPCRSDYLAPSEREEASRVFCQHVVYLFESLKRRPPDWASKGADEYYGAPERVNDATVLLCETIRGLTPKQLESIVYDGRSPKARALADFWDKHEAADKRREAEEKANADRERKSDEAEFERLRVKLGKR